MPIRSRTRCALLEPLESRRLLAAGDLDMSFGGGDGVATFSSQPGSQRDRGLFTAIDPQGRIVTAGVTAANASFGTPVDILVARYTPEGLIDTTFGGGDGFITRSFLNADIVTDLAVQPDGKILVACRNTQPAGWAVLRLKDDGSPDDSFGNQGATGVAAYDILGGADTIVRMALQPDGRIVSAGGASAVTSSGPSSATIVRMTPIGGLDSSFAGDGIATIDFSTGGINEFFDVAIDDAPGGARIVAAGRARAAPIGSNFDRIAVARFRASDGQPDTSFGGGDGLVEIAPVAGQHHLAHSVAVDDSSRVVITGFVQPTSAAMPVPLNFFRLTDVGLTDVTFNAAGPSPGRLEFPQATMVNFDLGDLLVQPDGKYLFGSAYTDATSNAFQLVRVNPDGTPDPTFSDDGHAKHTPTAPLLSGGTDVALDAAGRAVMSGVVVVNAAANDFDFASIRVETGLVVTPPVTLNAGALTIRGSDANDTVVLRRSGDLFLATLNGTTFEFNNADVSSIDVELFGGNDTQTHDGGVPGGRIDLGAGTSDAVTLNAGNRPDGLLTILGGGGNDTVTLNVAAFTPVFFDGGDDGAFADFLVYHGGQGNDTLNVSPTRIDNEGFFPAEFARVSNVTIHGNSGFDDFIVTGAEQGIYQLNGGNGNDTFLLLNGPTNTLLGSINIDGGAGNDAFTYDDSGGGSPQGTTISGNAGNFNGHSVDFDVEFMHYINGPGGRAILVTPSKTTAMTIDGNDPDDYPGDRLVIHPDITPAAHTRTTYADGTFTFNEGYLPVDYVSFERVVSNLDTAPPTATAQYHYQDRQEVQFAFSEDIHFSIDPADLELTNLTTGQVIFGDDLVLGASGGVNFTDRISWRPFSNQPLPDGNYRARIPAAAIRDYADKPLAADLILDFFVLAGDANRDRSVDFNDLVILAQNYGAAGRNFSQGNFNYDPAGSVNFEDLVLLAQRYGTTLTPPPMASAEIVTKTELEALSAVKRTPAVAFNARTPIQKRPRPPRDRI